MNHGIDDVRYEVVISSDHRYDDLVAEIYFDGKFIALINQESGINNMCIEFPSCSVDQNMVLRKVEVDVFNRLLLIAAEKLRG